MNITRADIERYLSEVYKAIHSGKYQISPREKNRDIYMDYIFTEADAKKVLLSLTADNFSYSTPNDHPKYSHEMLYIFGKVISVLPRFGDAEEKISLYIKFNLLKDHIYLLFHFISKNTRYPINSGRDNLHKKGGFQNGKGENAILYRMQGRNTVSVAACSL